MTALILIGLVGLTILFFITSFCIYENDEESVLSKIFASLGIALITVTLIFAYYGIKSFL